MAHKIVVYAILVIYAFIFVRTISFIHEYIYLREFFFYFLFISIHNSFSSVRSGGQTKTLGFNLCHLSTKGRKKNDEIPSPLVYNLRNV